LIATETAPPASEERDASHDHRRRATCVGESQGRTGQDRHRTLEFPLSSLDLGGNDAAERTPIGTK
jgi:hypothetical protein